jgi:ParB-like chromosome segregation protein Spo0J
MIIEVVPIGMLTEDPRNARKHPVNNLAAIKASLLQFGQVEPLVVQKSTGRVIGGNGRLQVMRDLGWCTVQTVRVDVDDRKAIALGVALNRSAETAEWNRPQLVDLLSEINEVADGLLESTGFDAGDLAKLCSTAEKTASVAAETAAETVRTVSFQAGVGTKHVCPECGCEF